MGNFVAITAGVKDNASSPMDRIRDKFAKLQADGGKGLVIGAAAGIAAVGFGLLTNAIGRATQLVGDSVHAYEEEEKSIAGLRAALQANVPAWDGETAGIEKVIKSRESLAFSDDSQRESLKLLLVATKDSSKALDVQRIAMDLARLKNIDLATASTLLAKVYNGNYTALNRMGIAIAKGSTATEAMGQVMKAVGGQAEAYANTDLGKVEAAQIKVNDSMEKIGESASKLSADVLPALAGAFAGVVDAISSVGDAAKNVAPGGGFDITAWLNFKDQGPVLAAEATDAASLAMDAMERTMLARRAGFTADGNLIAGYIAEGLTYEGAIAPAIDTLIGNLVSAIRKHRGELATEGSAAVDALFQPAEAALKGQELAQEVITINADLAKRLLDDNRAYHKAKTGAERDAILADEAQARLAAQQALTDNAKAQMNLLSQQTTFGSQTQRLAAINAILTGQAMADGLHSQDPQVAAAWATWQQSLQIEANNMAATAERAGADIPTHLQSGINSTAGLIGKAIDDATLPIRTMSSSTGSWGYSTGASYTTGIKNAIYAGAPAISGAVVYIGGILRALSPPGPRSPLHKIDVWGYNTGKEWADNFAEGLGGGGAKTVLSNVAAMLSGKMPNSPALSGGLVQAMASAGSGGSPVGFEGGPVSGGVPVEIPILIDGREIGRVVDEHLYYHARARSSYLPD